MTNFERITKSPEVLAVFIFATTEADVCPKTTSNCEDAGYDCEICWENWLKQEAEESEGKSE